MTCIIIRRLKNPYIINVLISVTVTFCLCFCGCSRTAIYHLNQGNKALNKGHGHIEIAVEEFTKAIYVDTIAVTDHPERLTQLRVDLAVCFAFSPITGIKVEPLIETDLQIPRSYQGDF